jgi:hypothetical protein
MTGLGDRMSNLDVIVIRGWANVGRFGQCGSVSGSKHIEYPYFVDHPAALKQPY